MSNVFNITISTLHPSDDGLNDIEIASIAVHIIVYVIGVIGTILIIATNVASKFFLKSGHWYVLQIAVANFIFLQIIPFKIVEITRNGWRFPVWTCKARDAVEMFSYHATAFFLLILAIDRCITSFRPDPNGKGNRCSLAKSVITILAWIVCLLIGVPNILYSDKIGIYPNCHCGIKFPRDAELMCKNEGLSGLSLRDCIETNQALFDAGCYEHERTIPIGSGFYFTDYYGSGNDWYDTIGWSGDNMTSGADINYYTPTEELFPPDCLHVENRFRIYITVMNVSMFLLPAAVMIVCYALVLFKPPIRDGSSDERGITYSALSLGLLFIVCGLPFSAVHFAMLRGIETTNVGFCSNLLTITTLILEFRAALIPVLYALVGCNVRNQIKKIREGRSYVA